MTTEGDQKDNWMIVKIKGLEDLLSLAQGSRIAKLRPNVAETLLKKKYTHKNDREIIFLWRAQN